MHFAFFPKGVTEGLAPRQATSSGDSFPLGHTSDLGFGDLHNADVLHMSLPYFPEQWSGVVHQAFNEIFD
eukprot:1887785-Karenia_brevis.AAC.1